MISKTGKTLFGLGLASLFLVGLPACDKKKDEDKQAKEEDKTDDKAEDEAEEKADEGGEEKAEEKAEAGAEGGEEMAASAEVEAGGKVEVLVDAKGYHPAEITAPGKSKITLAFKRTTDQGCGQELVVESMDVKKELPLNEVVEVEVEVPESGEVGFACGMNMYKGKVVPKS